MSIIDRRSVLAKLNPQQRQAHDMIEDCLKKILSGEYNLSNILCINNPDEILGQKSEQLRMIILSPEGTGKSLLIKAVTETFEYYAASERLAKCTTTGIAASLIEGKTLHSLISLGRAGAKEDWLTNCSEKTKAK